MEVIYGNSETPSRGYQGARVSEVECRAHLQNEVKDNLLDREETNAMLESLRTLESDTGFTQNDQLMADIQALEDDTVNTRDFRIGEAYAEIFLEENFQCRFHWNELRDARNPKGSKHGADLVGFIEVDGQVLFLFGEVKTSSEDTRPPQVMTNNDGMENQLRDLYTSREKRRILINYLQNKARLLSEGHPFKTDLEAGIRSYYSEDGAYQLFGVLVRDVEPYEQDVSVPYERLKEQILASTGLKLLALYMPIPKKEWLNIINEQEE